MISKDGKNLGFQKNQQLVVKNLKWFVTCTGKYTDITYQIPAPVIPSKLTNGLVN